MIAHPAEQLDLLELAAAARASELEVAVIDRPSAPTPVSIAAIGRDLEIVSTGRGAVLTDATGRQLSEDRSTNPLVAAQRLWTRTVAERWGPESGAIAVGGFAFDPTREPRGAWSGVPALRFRVPRLAVVRRGDGVSIWGDRELLAALDSVQPPRRAVASVRPRIGSQAWTNRVALAVARLRTGEAEKVVLARELVVKGALDPVSLARCLRRTHPSCFTYVFCDGAGAAFVGASPELLVRRRDGWATSQPMAGSIARGVDLDDDRRLADALQASAKDKAEHRLTARHVRDRLALVSRTVRMLGPEVVTLANIQHLATTIDADLGDAPPGLLDLAAVLHPTPAVNGHPVAAGARLIAEIEDLERGWYAGGVGWIDAAGDGEIAVALRCALVGALEARLYAGVGVMPGSDPATELAETNMKLSAMLSALGDRRTAGDKPERGIAAAYEPA